MLVREVYIIDCGILRPLESERDPCCVSLVMKKILKKDRGNGKKNPWAESGIRLKNFVWEKKYFNNFEMTEIIFKA